MKAAPVLRPATSQDLDACAAILGDWVAETAWMPKLHGPEEDRGFLRHLQASGEITVAEDPPLGFLARRGEEIPALYVAQETRGRGIGAALLRQAQQDADRLSLWTFRANKGARRFYTRHGFTEGARTEGENEEGLPDVQLLWRRP